MEMDPERNVVRLWNAFSLSKDNFSKGGIFCRDASLQNSQWSLYTGCIKCLSLVNPIKKIYAADKPTTVEKIGQTKPTVIITDEDITNYLQEETGKSRLKDLFTKNEDGSLHPDLQMVASSVTACWFVVLIGTSVFGAKAAREAFLLKSKHRKYESKFLYARAYNDAMIMGGLKFGLKWSFKTSIFTMLFSLTAQTMATYRNKTSIWEYAAGGMVTGSLLRISMGPKGMFAGGIIGGALGSIGGSCIYLLLKSGNETQERKHYWRTHTMLRRNRELELQFSKVKDTPGGPHLDLPSAEIN